jgi:hypothetical protein
MGDAVARSVVGWGCMSFVSRQTPLGVSILQHRGPAWSPRSTWSDTDSPVETASRPERLSFPPSSPLPSFLALDPHESCSYRPRASGMVGADLWSIFMMFSENSL